MSISIQGTGAVAPSVAAKTTETGTVPLRRPEGPQGDTVSLTKPMDEKQAQEALAFIQDTVSQKDGAGEISHSFDMNASPPAWGLSGA